MRLIWIISVLPLRFNRHFHHAVHSLTKQIVSWCDVVERESVCEQWREIDAAMTNDLHQPPHALFAARAKRRHDAMIPKARGEFLVRDPRLARVTAETRKRPRRSQTPQRTFESLLCSECFN